MSRAARRRRLAPPLLVILLATTIAFVLAGRGQGSPLPAGTFPLPMLGAADPDTIMMGAAPGGESGEAWGYRQLPLAVGGAEVGSGPLAFGPQADPASPSKQLAFFRYTDGNGWRVFQFPVDQNGNPYRGPEPNSASAQITPPGGGLLVGRDPNRPAGDQVVVLDHDPGGPWKALQAPPATALFPAEGAAPAEQLAADNGSGTVAAAAFDESGHTGLLFAPTGRSVADGILHYDGTAWTREEVQVPPASSSQFHVLAIDATGLGNAWAIAEADPAMGRSVVLLERTSSPGGPLWVERPLGAAAFANRETPGQISGLGAIAGAAQPLTVTSDGVWIDLTGTIEGAALDATVFYDIGAGSVTASWCDAAVCGAPLGAKLSRQVGYRSFAWPGPGAGTRVITNPLDVGGGEESNRGTYLRLSEGSFVREPGGGGNFRPTGAFTSADNGWLQGPVHISSETTPNLLRAWPVSLRAPLTAATTAPGYPSGALGSPALAVGVDGAIARYVPGQGWKREYLTTSNGSVSKVTLRGVAWPEAGHAYAVGDSGAMWQWNAADGLWIADPGVPIGFEGNLMGVAFDPSNPSRGYAVGKAGVVLGYGKSWEPEAVPGDFESANLTSIAFAGGEAIVAAGSDLLVNNGSGWGVDASAHALLSSVPGATPRLLTVAGLPDGGAVAAGRDVVIERDSATAPWHFSKQPILGSTAIAAAAFRSGGAVRAVVSVVPQLEYPIEDELPLPDPNVPPPVLPPFGLPGDGYLLRETDTGWEDEQRTAFAGAGPDRPLKTDPTLALLLDSAGQGWAIGGWSGNADSAGRGSSARGGAGSALRARVRTAAIARYGPGAASAPNGATLSSVAMPAGPVRFAVAGNAECEERCSELDVVSLGPDRTLEAALDTIAAMRSENGPRALLYTGNRVATGLDQADGERFAALLGSRPGVPTYPALGSDDVVDPVGSGVFESVFGGFPAPLGTGAAPAGVSTAGIPGAPGGSAGRTHYAFDSSGAGGTVRVIVIDNSRGSLAASDPYQNPPEAQRPWLEAALADARAKQIPSIVMGSRSLNSTFSPRLNVATDANEIAKVLVDGGASAYLFDRPEENRVMRIPAGGSTTIPSWGTGTLGYRSPLSAVVGQESPDALFGDTGVLLLELSANERDPATNRAPVRVRMIPILQNLSIEAIDGTLLRRSIPALFSGLGRRPLGGDRWGSGGGGSGIPDPAGGNPYTLFPPEPCLVAGCSERIAAEYTFTSSDDDIADFVKQDPASNNLRKPYLDPKGKVVTDNTSGLLCPFNAGTTTVTVSAGGYSQSEKITIQSGSVQRPCGTRPLKPSRFHSTEPEAATPPPPPAAGPGPSPAPVPPPAPGAPPAGSPPAAPAAHPVPAHVPPPVPATFLPVALAPVAFLPAAVLPPPPPAVRPTPPGGATARGYQVEEKEEDEVATEESKAFSRHQPGDEGLTVPPYLPVLILIAAIGAATVRGGPKAKRRVLPAAEYSGRRR